MKWLVALLILMVSLSAWPQSVDWEAKLTPYERHNLELNREWIARRRAHGENPKAEVGVFVDAGVWNLGAISMVKALEQSGLPCKVLTRDNLAQLKSLKALVLPGGYAGLQWMALGPDGCQGIREFVEGGGHCLGVCAGSYLISKTVRYQGIDYPYPIVLFDGVAEGPVAGLPDYPNWGPVFVKVTPEGAIRHLGVAQTRAALYGGGPRFTGGSDVKVLLTYPDGSAAAVTRHLGKGEVVAVGVHLEIANDQEGGMEASPPPASAALIRALLGI